MKQSQVSRVGPTKQSQVGQFDPRNSGKQDRAGPRKQSRAGMGWSQEKVANGTENSGKQDRAGPRKQSRAGLGWSQEKVANGTGLVPGNSRKWDRVWYAKARRSSSEHRGSGRPRPLARFVYKKAARLFTFAVRFQSSAKQLTTNMRSLVLLTLLGCACAVPFLQDTPEVVAERARFQQLFNAQAAAAAAAPDDPRSGGHQQYRHQSAPQQHFSSHHNQHSTFTPKWNGPVAATVPAGLPGSTAQVADTADVSAARNAFLAAYRAQVAATTGHNTAPQHSFNAPTHGAPRHFNALPSGPVKWTGPVAATVPAGVDGRVTPVSDTADVAAAKAAFLNTYNAALGATRPSGHNQFRHSAPVQHHQPSHQPRWTGPVAATVPAGLPGSSSQVSQTADVAAATAAFQQAYTNAVAATTGRRF
ncbi:hypothetical protein FHG87_013197 [Trinorchestia longiramus]|nr:hypothetical protein FHG87_013197 [Trinorchestia longiramus]